MKLKRTYNQKAFTRLRSWLLEIPFTECARRIVHRSYSIGGYASAGFARRKQGAVANVFTVVGFTMVEMLVAVTIIAILILPLAGFLSGHLKRDERTIETRLALSVARQTMDRLLAAEVSPYNIKDDSLAVNVNGKQWVVVIDPIDGHELGEPANGTDPLEIRVRVYSLNNKRLMARLTALKGQ